MQVAVLHSWDIVRLQESVSKQLFYKFVLAEPAPIKGVVGVSLA